MPIDLHMHSTASDGTDAPAALASIAKAAGLSAIALTDHDTTAGLADCARACRKAGVRFVPGIELSADRGRPRGNLHILGYFIDPANAALVKVVDELQTARRARNPEMVRRLNDLGVDMTLAEVEAEAGGMTVGRPHIAAVLVKKGYAKSIQDAFTRYIGQGAAAYCRKDNLQPHRAIDAIHAAGGLAVLAHSIQLRADDQADLEQLVHDLVEQGIDGLEAYHPDHSAAERRHMQHLAERFGLFTTGGSDYHGDRKAITIGSQRVPDEVLDDMQAAMSRRNA